MVELDTTPPTATDMELNVVATPATQAVPPAGKTCAVEAERYSGEKQAAPIESNIVKTDRCVRAKLFTDGILLMSRMEMLGPWGKLTGATVNPRGQRVNPIKAVEKN